MQSLQRDLNYDEMSFGVVVVASNDWFVSMTRALTSDCKCIGNLEVFEKVSANELKLFEKEKQYKHRVCAYVKRKHQEHCELYTGD